LIDAVKTRIDLVESTINLLKALVNLLKALVNLLKAFVNLLKVSRCLLAVLLDFIQQARKFIAPRELFRDNAFDKRDKARIAFEDAGQAIQYEFLKFFD